MRYAEHAPAPALLPFVERYWSFELEAHDPASVDHVVLPHGGCNLTLIEPPHAPTPIVTLQGPACQALQLTIQQGVRYRGARLRAGALGPLLGYAHRIQLPGQRPVLMQEWHAELAAQWQNRLAGATSLEAFSQAADVTLLALPLQTPDPIVAAIVQRLDTDTEPASLSQLLTSFAVGERQARRRFVAEAGITPKVYARLRRIRRVCADMARAQPLPGAELAASHGYADQAHLAREIREVFGRSSLLLQGYLRQIDHQNVAELAA